ncbi:WD40/YVTN/BNR-like repeat-containing protein [Conexibacter woesei]|uniref:Photosynthesis system II assembly factor Ycf48/Hcf136-like domain-containing protein n=1 Tax=Conexibacter woesei (strain DSM 14684 / CCUG 47730 / CIP 108061 / JCM 11494 / NBRC 100937 / ID131577) TaxID=469383 RepID=D3F1N3_CONWI|nr:hypothetical protein [Conexibacter woesei]ADB54064.1 hypothetical protein Cwoe_5660 [Conexibacter woesei DSM 14684]
MFLKRALTASLLAAALAAPASASANVQVGSSGWEWGNPLPQGNTLRATSFAGTTGYAVGDFGTLLKTTDGGGTWSGLRVSTFAPLTIVQTLDANTVLAGGGCVARRSTDGGRTFTSIAFTPVETSCRASLTDMSFASPTVGFLLLSDGSVFSTDDGGTQFTPRTAVPGTAAAGGSVAPASVAFTGPATGFAATTDGRIFATTDGAVSWRVVAETGRAIRQLSFADPAHGFAVGQNGLFARTVDGGQRWTPKDLGAGALDYTAIRCANAELCVLSTATGAQLVRTSDAGETAGAVITPSTDPIYAAAFASPTRIAAVGASGSTVVSDDAGTTFRAIGGRLTGSYGAVYDGAARGSAFALGEAGALAKTLDGGRTWTRGNVPTTAGLRHVSFPTTSVGYALDDDGGLFRTANGGTSWKTLGTGSAARPAAVHAPSESTLLAIGPRGVRRSTDGGETFSPVRARAISRAALYGAAAPRGAIVAWGPTTFARSRDGGRTWTTLRKPGGTRRARSGMRIALVAFSSADAALLLDRAGTVWRTTNGGRTWSTLPAIGTSAIDGLVVDDDRTAYVVPRRFGEVEGGYLLRTTDGGATWQPQLVVREAINGIATSGSATDYLLGGSSQLLSSTTGGSAGRRSTLTLATSRRTLRKPAPVTVTGRLRPAGPAARVTVSMREPGGRWRSQTVDVASNGTFASRWRVARGTTTFVAQWSGDFTSAGAGSRVLTVTARAPPRRSGGRGRRGRRG